MIASLTDDEKKTMMKCIKKELEEDYPDIKMNDISVDFDGVTIWANCDYDWEDYGNRLDFELDINDTPCTNDPLDDIPDHMIDEFVTAIACDIEEMKEGDEDEDN